MKSTARITLVSVDDFLGGETLQTIMYSMHSAYSLTGYLYIMAKKKTSHFCFVFRNNQTVGLNC